MHHSRLLVHEAHGRHKAAQDLARLGLAEVSLLADVLQQLPTLQQLQDQVRVQLRVAGRATVTTGSRITSGPGQAPPTSQIPLCGHHQTPSPASGPAHVSVLNSRPHQEPPSSSTTLSPTVFQAHVPLVTLKPRPHKFPSPSHALQFRSLGHPQPCLQVFKPYFSQISPPWRQVFRHLHRPSGPSHGALRPPPPSILPSSSCAPAFRPSPRRRHLVVMHFVQLHYVGVRLAQPQGGHFALRIRLQPGGGGGGSGQPPSGPALPESPPPGPAHPGSAHLRLRILTANSWPLWRCRQRRHTEKLPWPSAGSRRSSSYCWKKGESWGRRGGASEVLPGSLEAMPCPISERKSQRAPGEVRSGVPKPRCPQAHLSPSWPNPPASWRSWPPLPGRAGLQHQPPPVHLSSPRCCGQTGWRAPRRSIPGGEGGLSGVDGHLGDGDANGVPKGPDPAEEGWGQRKDPGLEGRGAVAFASRCTQDAWTLYSTLLYDLLGPCLSPTSLRGHLSHHSGFPPLPAKYQRHQLAQCGGPEYDAQKA